MFKRFLKLKVITIVLVLILSPILAAYIKAAPHNINYHGVILDVNSNPITDPLTFRFSLWQNADFLSSDVLPNGAVNEASSGYAGYTEVQTIVPDANGNFNTAIGIILPLPAMDPSLHKFLQVEIKGNTDPDTEFEVLDIDTDINNINDRKMLSSAPYAITAESVEDIILGYSGGNVAQLDQNGQFLIQAIPNFTDQNDFTINQANGTGDTKLLFGDALGKVLKWAETLARFELGDSLFVWGDISNSGDVKLGDDLSDSVIIAGNTILTGGSLIVNGDVNLGDSFGDTINIAGNINVSTGSFATNGDVNLGNDIGDTVSIAGDVTTNGSLTTNGSVVLGDDPQDTVGIAGSLTVAGDVSGGDADFSDLSVDNIEITGNLSFSGTINGLDFDDFYDKTSDDASSIAFSGTGYSATNVLEALNEVNDIITSAGPSGKIIMYAWDYIPGTTGNQYTKQSHATTNKPYVMLRDGVVTAIGLSSNPKHKLADGEYVIVKNDNGNGYDVNKRVTWITQTSIGEGDANNTVYSSTPNVGAAGLSLSAGDVLRAYKVGESDKLTNLILEITYN